MYTTNAEAFPFEARSLSTRTAISSAAGPAGRGKGAGKGTVSPGAVEVAGGASGAAHLTVASAAGVVAVGAGRAVHAAAAFQAVSVAGSPGRTGEGVAPARASCFPGFSDPVSRLFKSLMKTDARQKSEQMGLSKIRDTRP